MSLPLFLPRNTQNGLWPSLNTRKVFGDVKYWKYNLGVGGLGFQCLLCAAKRLQCVLW